MRVMIGVPCYTGQLQSAMGRALMRGQDEITARWGKPTLYIHAHCSIVSRARNLILAQFLASDCDVLVTIDDDIAWDGDELLRLIAHEGDMVAGIYRPKEDAERYHCRLVNPLAVPDGGLLEADRVPAGFLKLTRACVEKMRKTYVHLAYFDPHSPTKEAHDLFSFVVEDHAFWGEDYTFCRRWRSIGGRIWVDPDMTLHHVGTYPEQDTDGQFRLKPRSFTGNYAAWLRSQQKQAA